VKTTPANLHDSRMALHLLVSMPAIPGPRGRPRIKPKILQGDAAYGCATLAALVKALGVRPPGQSHVKLFGKEDLRQVAVVPSRGQTFVLDPDLE
jgi:hypothetical protein